MVDAVHVQHVERAVHQLRAALLAGVRDALEPHPAGLLVDAGEPLGRVAHLGGVEPDADKPLDPGPRLRQRHERALLGVVAQEAQEQSAGDAVLGLSLRQTVENAADDGVELDAAGRVRLRIEERLDVPHVVGVCPRKVGQRQVAEVLAGDEHRASRVVDIEKRLQVGELVRRPGFVGTRKLRLHAVLLCK